MDMLFRICQRTDTRDVFQAVKQSGYALKFVKEQTPEICLEAVKQNGLVFIFCPRTDTRDVFLKLLNKIVGL